MKARVVSVIIALAVLGSLFFGFKYYSNNANKGMSVSFSESYLEEESLVEKADLIVSGKIEKLKKKEENKIIKKSKEDEADVEWTYGIYDLKVKDVINGKAPKEINLVFAGNDLPKEISINKKYIFFLEKKGKLGEDYYHLLSYSQGVWVEKANKLVSVVSKEEYSKKSLQEKIKKHKK